MKLILSTAKVMLLLSSFAMVAYAVEEIDDPGEGGGGGCNGGRTVCLTSNGTVAGCTGC